jgi:transposase
MGRIRHYPLPETCSLDELSLAIDCCPDQKAQARLNAIHLLLCGATFELVLKHARVKERTLQLWINRFNAQGIDALTYRPKSGRPRCLAPELVRSQIIPLVDDPTLADQDHWTGVKLCGWLREHKEIELCYSTLVRYLHEHDYARRIPRPMPEPPDRELWHKRREEFLEQMVQWAAEPGAKVFFGDEAGFEADPRPRQRWVKRGSRPTQPYYGGHLRRNVVGAVNPEDGQLVSLIVPHNDTAVFQAFLDTMAEEVPDTGPPVYLILDNASWHKAKSLNWHHLTPKFLPSYSPDFNPIERFWQRIKSHYMAGFITNRADQLIQKLIDSIRDMIDQPDVIKSVCANHIK